MGQFVHDPDFDIPSAWDIIGGGATVSGGRLRYVLAGSFRCAPEPSKRPVVGQDYRYRIDVPEQANLLGTQQVKFAGHTLWEKTQGPGVFSGDLVALNDNELIFQGFSGATYQVESISIEDIMIDYPTIRLGMRAILLAVPTIPTDIAFENREFKPPVATSPYIREQLIPGAERHVATGTIMAVGIMQYDLFWPAGDGTEDPEALADAIRDAFRPVTTIDAHTTVYRVDRLSGVPDEKWYRIPIRLTYRSYSIQ